MNRSVMLLLGAALLLLVPLMLAGIVGVVTYNGLVNREEAVYSAWSQVESNLQRRADLVPLLVKTVRQALAHEKNLQLGVTDRRAEAMETDLQRLDRLRRTIATLTGARNTTESTEHLRTLAEAEQRLGRAMRNLLAVVENYPAVRATDNLLALQDQLKGTENRLNVARMAYNEAVRDFNAAMRRFPGALIVGLAGFKRKGYFEAEEPARPGVDFEEEAP